MSEVSTIFGPLVVLTQVDDVVLAHLKKWMHTHLLQVEREIGNAGYERMRTNRLMRPRSYATLLEDDRLLDQALPAVVVTTQGTDGIEYNGPDIGAWFKLTILVVARGRDRDEARLHAAMYAAAVRQALQNHPSLDGFAHGVEWTDENVEPVEDTTGKGRTLAAGISEWRVLVDQVAQRYGGPSEPDPDPVDLDEDVAPHPDWPLVEDITITVTGKTTITND